MKILNFNEYMKSCDFLKRQIQRLFESNLISEQLIKFSPELKGIFDAIGNENQIAHFLLDLLGSDNVIDIDGELKNVEEVLPSSKKTDFFEILYTDSRGKVRSQEIKIGKFINSLLKEIKKKNINPKAHEIEEFVRKVFAYREGDVVSDYEYRLVSGNDIPKYYLETNSECLSGGLGGSCMRFQEKNKFINVYGDEFSSSCTTFN